MGQCSSGPNPSAVPAAELPEELVEEILLRFPPDEPASLVRAALVCKKWCRLISGPSFRRRFREFHRTPPMAGFLCSSVLARDGVEAAVRFVPTTSAFRSPLPELDLDLGRCHAIDARHGRVLLQCPAGKAADASESVLVVWDPISDERRELPVPSWDWNACRWSWNAAVLCAATAAGGPCDHLHCHRGPFLVVFVNFNSSCLFISTYSSDSGTWTDRIFPLYSADYVSLSSSPCAQVGNALYFASETSSTALKYDFCLHQMSLISVPPMHALVFPYVLTTTEEGRLRYTVIDRSKLYMWSRVEDGHDHQHTRWTRDHGWKQDRVIELKMLLPNIWASLRIIGFADGAGVIFLTAYDVHFTVDLNTKKVKKLVSKDKTVDKALPYMSFYTPALGAAFRGEGPSQGGSNA